MGDRFTPYTVSGGGDRVVDTAPLFRLGRHPATTLCTPTAGGDARLHIPDRFTTCGTSVAHRGTDSAQLGAEGRAAELQAGTRLADLYAIQHESDMVGFNVLPSRFQTMIQQAGITGLGTG